MLNINQILKDYNGIIGAILGSMVTLITTELLKGRGRLKFYVTDCKFDGTAYGKFASEFPGKKCTDIVQIRNCFNIELYNPSDSPKILRNIIVSFKQRLLSPSHLNILNYMAIPEYQDKPLNIININPKEIIYLTLKVNANEENAEKVYRSNNVHLECVDDKNRNYDILLANIEYKGHIRQH